MLYQLLGAYFGQDVFFEFETLPEARQAAVGGFDLVDKKKLATEWWNWSSTISAAGDVRAYLNACGVELDFESEQEARQFMNDIYDALIVGIRQVEKGWKP